MSMQKRFKALGRRLSGKQRFRHRGYIAGGVGFAELADALAAMQVDHLFFNWPGADVPWPGAEEVILLVSDHDLGRVTKLLRPQRRNGDIACRLFTLGGLPGSDRNGVAWLPVSRAREMLAVAGRSGTYLASDEQRLLAMCHEAVYHLGTSSGLPIRAGLPSSAGMSPFAQAIQALNERCALWPNPQAMGLEELDERLAESGWRPSTDTLSKLSQANPWVAQIVALAHRGYPDAVPGLAVMLVREQGLPYLDAFRRTLEHHGFDVLCELAIDSEDRLRVADRIRGGNWGRGPFPCSGGLPAHLLVIHDVHPDVSRSEAAGANELVDNARVFTAKESMRRRMNRHRPARQHCNPLHSSDNAAQAVEYLSVVAPDRIDAILEQARQRNAAYRTPYPVLADLSKHARRAKVELVDFHGTQAICKTFRPGRERFMEREIQARELGKALPEVSSILEIGPRHLVFEWYADNLQRILSPRAPFYRHGMLPIWAIERLRHVILHYRRLGYECIDLNPHNLIYDPCQGLKIIDFEFLQPGPRGVDTLKGNYAWYAVPGDFAGDVPQAARYRPYLRRWLPYTGLPRLLCLHELPRPVLVVIRSFFLVPLTLAGMKRAGRRYIRRLRRQAVAK
ncbi:hypothetical protein LY622_04820 [Halomonas sp. M5N1S17]|uniref:hypothetical protein n=1 Tax=Halomonas alkalisoli TaxID=2907158 RepID=UPI001F1AB079|nr:hypothetical protein [Halomonas alkalisoli]MCE9662756.1 hypothetical protein [Halomonas alkalisoli]